MIIPPEVCSLSPAQTFICYRDCGLHVYPVYPPWAKVKDAGKKPAWHQWWESNSHDCNIQKHFKGKHPDNIGACPQRPTYFLDLDSKEDKGASVREYLGVRPELQKFPRHASRAGEHLIVQCEDVPPMFDQRGDPYHKPLCVQLTEKVSVEFFHSSHSNLVLPPSQHPLRDSDDEPYFVYHWTQTGEVPLVSWQWLCDTFGLAVPVYAPKTRTKKSSSWYLKFRGDLASLDLVAVLEKLGHPPVLANADEKKYGIRCPWNDEHSDPDTTVDAGGTSTVIWLPAEDGKWPGFDCKHRHCTGRGLQELLEWAETKEPGIIDAHCTRQRVWDMSAHQHVGRNQLPQVLHAVGRLESDVYDEVGRLIAPHHGWFNRGSALVHLESVPNGFQYSSNPKERYKVTSTTTGFRELSPLKAKSMLEHFMEPGVLRQDDNDESVFVPQSFTTDFCAGMIQSDQLKDHLDRITRILTIPIPFRVDDQLIYPHKGFDPRFGTYLLPDSPDLNDAMPIEEAWTWIAEIFSGFCFTSEQSRTHAVARLLTPFGRAILGWTTRVPLWVYIGSRPRCGKDYLSGCSMIIYEGTASEDQPIAGRDSAVETGKRILSAARAGRRFMHFANCEQNLKDASLTHAITAPSFSGRNLGSNDPKADVTVPNELEFSLSFNLGIRITEDMEPRTRPISLAFYEENPNARTFPDPDKHATLLKTRAKSVSALAAIFKMWWKSGFPEGKTPFASFPGWTRHIGGVLSANRSYMYDAFDPLPIKGEKQTKTKAIPSGWGDPCLPWDDEFSQRAGDQRTAALRVLFIVCEKDFGNQWVTNKQIIACVTKYQSLEEEESKEGTQDIPPEDSEHNQTDDARKTAESLTDAQVEALAWFGHLDQTQDAHASKKHNVHGNKVALMMAVRDFQGRTLAGITLHIKPNVSKKNRDQYQFVVEPAPQSPVTPSQAETAPVTPAVPRNTPQEGYAPENPSQNAQVGSAGSVWQSFCVLPQVAREKSRDTLDKKEGERVKKKGSLGSRNSKKSPKSIKTTSFALDLETYAEPKIGRNGRITLSADALDPFKGGIRLVTIADTEGNISQFDLRAQPKLPTDIALALALDELVIHNAAFELRFLATKFGLFPERVFCTLTASRLLAPLKSVQHGLGPVLERYLDVELPKELGGSDWGAMVLTPAQLQYARDDVRYLHRLRAILESELATQELSHVFELEIELLPVIARMELHGYSVDVPRLKAVITQQETCRKTKLEALRSAFKKPAFSPSSPDQILEAFKELGIELRKTDPDGKERETTEEELLCTIDDPRAGLLLEYRKADKLLSALASLLDSVRDDSRIYAQFNPLGAMTGRFSSKDPNLQQVPKKGAQAVRSVFVAGGTADRRLIVADYSQIELRVVALVANEGVMIEAFRKKLDLHVKIAAASLRIAGAEVSKDQRDIGKTINFGFVYGRSAEGYRRGVRKDYGLILSPGQAHDYRASFFATYPAIAAWHEDCRRKAKDPHNDRTRTIFGRLLRAQRDDPWARFNLLTNYVVQGSCADLLKLAMVKIAGILPSDAYLVATVHDELIYEVEADLASQYRDMIRLAMEEAFTQMFGASVPIEVEAKVCSNWGEK